LSPTEKTKLKDILGYEQAMKYILGPNSRTQKVTPGSLVSQIFPGYNPS